VEREARYAVVGLFALLTLALAFAFVWWYTGAGDQRSYDRYEIYFDGSVSGLSQGSPVRYLGVDVGRVQSLSVDASRPGEVLVRVITEIDATAPVSSRTRARLGLLGLTGLLYIDLQQEPTARDEPLPQGERYPVIQSRPGDIEAFLAKLPDLVGRAAGVMERVELLLSEQNVATVSAALGDVRRASAQLPALAGNAAALADEMHRTTAEVTALAAQLRDTVNGSQPHLQASLTSVRETSERLSSIAESLERVIVANEMGLRQIAGPGAQELQQLLVDAREASTEIRALAQSLRQNPSRLIREPAESGVEIKP